MKEFLMNPGAVVGVALMIFGLSMLAVMSVRDYRRMKARQAKGSTALVRPVTIADLAPAVVIKAGDTLIVSFTRPASREERDRIRDMVKADLPPGVRVVVTSGARLTVAKGVE